MENAKRKIIYFWLTRVFLRRIGKRYPEFFKQWVYESTDNRIERQILLLRYTGIEQMKFEAIAIKMNMDLSNLFKYHKKAVESMVCGQI